MAEREQIQRTPSDSDVDNDDVTAAASDKGQEIKSDLDDLLDEIDDVLETNAEEFVKSYIQKGGQ